YWRGLGLRGFAQTTAAQLQRAHGCRYFARAAGGDLQIGENGFTGFQRAGPEHTNGVANVPEHPLQRLLTFPKTDDYRGVAFELAQVEGRRERVAMPAPDETCGRHCPREWDR